MKFDLFEVSLVFLFGLMIGLGIGGALYEFDGKHEAIRHHAAHYDSVTGNWHWNDETSK